MSERGGGRGVEGRGSYGIVIVLFVSWSSVPNRPCHVSCLSPSVHKAPNPYITPHHRQCTTLFLFQKSLVLQTPVPYRNPSLCLGVYKGDEGMRNLRGQGEERRGN